MDTSKLVILELEGDFQSSGFRATLEIRPDATLAMLTVRGFLPPAPDLALQLTQHWQQHYRSLGMAHRIKGQKIIHKGSLNRRLSECRESAQQVCDRFRTWLNAESFQAIDRRLREDLHREERVRFLIRTDHPQIQRLPWHEWDFFERYTQAELAFSPTEQEVISPPVIVDKPATVRILAILGNSWGIDLEGDRHRLRTLPHADVEFLVEPDRQQVSDRLWEQPWDILFFAGHSETQNDTGRIYINRTDSLSLSELKYGLRKAIAQGLQLAIFNSCDGLGLAYDLKQLHLPQLIVMREPIVDQVAHTFLQYFLDAFSTGSSLYLATRCARERLQGVEHQFPCASWLPIIYQNALVSPPDWSDLQGPPPSLPHPLPPPPPSPSWKRSLPSLGISLAVTAAILLVRLLGILQPLELAACDHLLRLRPAEEIDSRILVVEVTQEDVNNLGGYPLTDAVLRRTVESLRPHNPAAIAFDMHRYQPRGEGRDDLMALFRQMPNL